MKTQSDIDLERYYMWVNILGAAYASASKNKKKKMKENYMTQYYVPLGTCYQTGPAINHYIKKEEIPMFNERQEQIDRIKHRASEVHDKLYNKGRKAFFLEAPRPKTLGEYKKWLTEGNYTIDTKHLSDDASYESYAISSFFRWGKDLPDEKGFEEWLKTIDKAHTNVRDLALLSYEAGLKALQAFEQMDPAN